MPPVINRRHALGLLAAASILPSRSLANVSYQRSEFREGLARRFFDLGTEGTFVAYKVDDYLIIASDKVRSGEGKLPASTFKIPNSLIALETGVVAGSRQGRVQVGRGEARYRGLEQGPHLALGDRRFRRAGLSGDRPAHRTGADAEICRPVRIRQPRYRRRHRPVLADRQFAHRSGPADRFRRPAATRRAAGLQALPKNWCATSCR